MVVHACNFSMWQAESGVSLGHLVHFRLPLATVRSCLKRLPRPISISVYSVSNRVQVLSKQINPIHISITDICLVYEYFCFC